MKKIIVLGLAVLVSLTICAQEETTEIIKVNDSAPAFTLQTLDGKLFNTADLRGKVIYINFFATWCGPCMKEMPHIESDIWKGIKNSDFVMLCIAREQTAEVIAKFKNEKGFTMPMAVDVDRKVYSLYAPQYIPRNIVINREGKIIYSGKDYNLEKFNKMVELIKNELN